MDKTTTALIAGGAVAFALALWLWNEQQQQHAKLLALEKEINKQCSMNKVFRADKSPLNSGPDVLQQHHICTAPLPADLLINPLESTEARGDKSREAKMTATKTD